MNITTLIPAYKTAYLAELLNALRLQTVRPHRVVVSDDSPQGVFRETLFSAPYRPLHAGLNIEVVEGPRTGAPDNVRQLMRIGTDGADLLHVMLDDDVVYPTFYERHLAAHASGDFSCSVSRRWTADERGQPTSGQPVPAAVASHAARMLSIGDEVLFATAVLCCNNWLGEYSHAVFRADCRDLIADPQLGGVSCAGLWDLGAFVAASLRRPLCHLQDHLGFFRISAGQNSSQLMSPIMKGAHLGYAAIAIGGLRLGRVDPAQARRCFAAMLPTIKQRYGAEADMAALCRTLGELARGEDGAEARFVEAWAAFLAMHRM